MSGRSWRADPALKPQPKREGPDLWPTPLCLIGALIADVLPHLPAGRVWEPAAGDGRLVEAIRGTGRIVSATDVKTCDFLAEAAPNHSAAIVTNPPFNQVDKFIKRALEHLDAGTTKSVVLLMRWDHLTAMTRTCALERAAEIRLCTWRPIWIEGTKTSPRWSFCWVTWRQDYNGPPVHARSRKPDYHKKRS